MKFSHREFSAFTGYSELWAFFLLGNNAQNLLLFSYTSYKMAQNFLKVVQLIIAFKIFKQTQCSSCWTHITKVLVAFMIVFCCSHVVLQCDKVVLPCQNMPCPILHLLYYISQDAENSTHLIIASVAVRSIACILLSSWFAGVP